jgi:hypothetical protein
LDFRADGTTSVAALLSGPPGADGERTPTMMDITRNQYFFAGVVFLFLGIELLSVDCFTLTPEFTQFLAERTGHPMAAVSATTQSLFQSDSPPIQKSVFPPPWIGWMLLSLGSVLVLHSWGMQKPGS